MSDLEDLIRNAAKNGELTHLSVVPIAGKGPNGIGWSASFSPGSVWGSGFATHVDPVEAIKLAMTDTRLGKIARKLEKTIAEAPPEMVAAARKKLGITTPPPVPPVDDSDFV